MATTGFVSHKEPMIGWAIQSALGVPAAVATHVFPLPEGTDFGPKVSKEIYQVNMGNQERAHYFLKSKVAEGTIKFPLVPGMLVAPAPAAGASLNPSAGSLSQWLFGRTSGQSLYATIFMYLGHDLTDAGNFLKFPDVKCTGGQFDVAEENMVHLSAKCLGGKVLPGAAANFPTYSTGVYWDGAPYTYTDAEIQLGFGGTVLSPAALAPDSITKGHTIEWNNMTLDQSAATCIVYGATGPYNIPNSAKPQWKVGFSRFFYDIQAMTDYLSETAEAAYKLTLGKGANVGILSFPRCLIVEGGVPKLPADGVLMNDGLSFEALGGLTGPGATAIPCFSWQES